MRDKRYFSTDLEDNEYRRIIKVSRRQQSYNFTPVHPSLSPYINFVKINGIIYFVPNSLILIHNLSVRYPLNQFGYGEQKAPLTVLNKTTLDPSFNSIAYEKLPRKTKNKYIYNLKRYSPVPTIKDYPSSKCIFDLNGSFLKYEKPFVYVPIVT